MIVKDNVWMGIRTEKFDEMVKFYKQLMGLSVIKESSQESAWFKLQNGHQIEVYGPGDQDHKFFFSGPIIGFLVDDVEKAQKEMEAAGIEFIGSVQRSKRNIWNHFRAPDGNIYEIISENQSSKQEVER